MSWIPTIFPHDAEQMERDELLACVLGTRLVALALGRHDVRLVEQQLRESHGWSDSEAVRLDSLHQLCLTISQIHADVEIIQRWLLSPHPLLDQRSTLQCVREGEPLERLDAAARQYILGTVRMRLVKF